MIKTKLHILLIIFCLNVQAQQNNTLYFMPHLPERNDLNPSFQNNYKWYIGPPFISSFYMNYAHSGFTLDKVWEIENGNYSLNSNLIYKRTTNTNYLGLEFQTRLFDLGYRLHDFYYTFSITEKVNFPFFYDKDIMFITEGNIDQLGKQTELNGMGFFFNYYREYAFGISQSFRDRAFGVKGKLLFGKLNVSTSRSRIQMETPNPPFELNFKNDLRFNTSIPLNVIMKSDGVTASSLDLQTPSILRTFFNFRNVGLAFDAGFHYNPSSNITLYGSLIDVGFILWNDNAHKFKSKNQYNYQGFLSDEQDHTGIAEDFFKAYFAGSAFSVRKKSYINLLPSRLYAGGTYRFYDYMDLGLLVSGQIYRKKIMPSMSLSLNTFMTDWFSASLSYTLSYRSFENVGLGLTLGRSPVQFYVVTDNMPGLTFPFRNNEVSLQDKVLLWPLFVQNINIRFGMNINLMPGETLRLLKLQRDHEQSSTPDLNSREWRRIKKQRSDKILKRLRRKKHI